MRLKKGERAQQRYENDMKKLVPYGIQTDEQGRYLVYFDNTGKLPQAYFADKTGARIRICASTFQRWLEEGKAVEVAEEDLPRRKKKKSQT